MGCGASAGSQVEPEPEDPLAKLLELIHGEQDKLRGVLPELTDKKNEARFLFNANHAMKITTNKMKRDVRMEKRLYADLKMHTADRDAYDLREASKGFGTDESKMAGVIVTRAQENLKLIDDIYQRRYGRTVEDQIRGENHTLIGLLTGGLTHFGRFLWYMTVPQPKRDAFLIRKAMSGMGCSDYILMEVVSTRTNQELKDAAGAYAEEYDGEDMVERIKSETGGFGKKWYGKWVDTLVEFDRDESEGVQGEPAELAQQLYDAGAGKWTGTDEQVFLDILCKANEETCIAISAAYDELEDSKRSLREDVEKEMGGDLEFAVLARVLPKNKFLAVRIYKACKGWGTDEECIARALGCLDKKDAAEVEAYYNAEYGEEEEPFNSLRALLASELSGSFLEALLLFLETCPPKGHHQPETVYDPKSEKAGAEFQGKAEEVYCREHAKELGQKKGKQHLSLAGLSKEEHFLLEEYQKALPPKWKQPFNSDKFSDLLEVDDPTAVEAAEQLLDALRKRNEEVEGALEQVTNRIPTYIGEYKGRCEALRRNEHLVRQFKGDNDKLLDFNASRDADIVRVAVDGWGTDEDKLIRTLCTLQKPMIRRTDAVYQDRYGKSLREVTDDELSGFFEGSFKYFMKCVLTPDDELDAELLVESMKGFGTDDQMLCEIVCTRTNDELHAACAAFEAKEGKSAFDWVDGDTSGGYGRFLLECLKGERQEDEDEPDEREAKEQAEKLHGAGLGEGDMNAEAVIEVLANESECQIKAIQAAYEAAYGVALLDAIDNVGGDWAKALRARVTDRETYFAETLEKAMKGLGTDENALSRILGRTPKAQMQEVAAKYEELHGRSLHDAIESETSGNFKKALLTMLFAEKPGEDADPGVEEEE